MLLVGLVFNCMYLMLCVLLIEWVIDVVEMLDVEIIDFDVILLVVVVLCIYVECG